VVVYGGYSKIKLKRDTEKGGDFSRQPLLRIRYVYSGSASKNLKVLSHEIDFKNFDKNLQNLAYLRDAAGF
jgi:hypothetical protein